MMDCNGRECDFCLEDIRRTSAAFWNRFTLSTERWVDRLVHFANGDRFLAMSLVLQTPLILIVGNQWVGLLRFQKQDALVMLALEDAVVPRSPDSYGYPIDDALIHMAMCFGRGVTLQRRYHRSLRPGTDPDRAALVPTSVRGDGSRQQVGARGVGAPNSSCRTDGTRFSSSHHGRGFV